jgi:hypothetical protein
VEVQVYQAGHDELVCTVDDLGLAVVVVLLTSCRALVDVVDPVISHLQDAGIDESVFGIQCEDGGIRDDDSAAHCPLSKQGGRVSATVDLRLLKYRK